MDATMTQEATQLRTDPPYPGLAMVQDINKALQTLGTDFAGAIDPAALAWAYSTWADTSTGTLKRRNAANTAWVIEGRLFVAHMPIIPLADVPTTDIGQISVVTKGIMEWDGAAYAALAQDPEAIDVSYDNTGNELAAEDVQAAIDETLGVARTFIANDPRVKTAVNASGAAPIFACRAWVNFNGTGVVAIRASGNVSSITDNGTGDYTINFAEGIADIDYCLNATVKNNLDSSASIQASVAFPTVYGQESARVVTGAWRINQNGGTDMTHINVSIFR